MKGRLTAVLVACALVLTSASTKADEATEATLQFELGAELYKQGKYVEALGRFLASHRLVPNARVVENIAQTFEFLGKLVDAYNWWDVHSRLATSSADRARGAKRRDALAAKVAAVDIQTTPPEATIFIDRIELGAVGRSPRRVAVAPGSHKVILKRKGYVPVEVDVDAKLGERTTVQQQMTPVKAAVAITSTPSGAVVTLRSSGAELGQTPLRIQLPLGSYEFRLKLPGYVDGTARTDLRTEGSQLHVPLKRDMMSVASLRIRGNVAARARIGDRDLGASPISTDAIPQGSYPLRIEAPGYYPWATNVTLEQGATLRVDYRLRAEESEIWPTARWFGYGVGGALLIGGGAFGLHAVSVKDDLEQDPSREAFDDLDTANLTADVLWISGAVILAATLIYDLIHEGPARSTGDFRLDR